MEALFRRERAIERLKAETFDVLILGGGINGAGVARDLALRARRTGRELRIGLIEQRHFASGTSGKNSQLIHGGLRYLKYLEFGLVRNALRERATLLELAPHLVEPLPFLIPMYSHFARLFYGAGLRLYDALAGSRNIARHRRLAQSEVTSLEPQLESDELAGGAVFYDCRINSARFVLENIFDAVDNGAVAANYVRCQTRAFGDGVWTVTAEDALTGQSFPIRSRKLVDTTGPWASGDAVRLVRGSHLVMPRIQDSDFAIAHFEPSGRVVFLIPWGESGELTLVGTTDVDHSDGPDRVRISSEEVRYLLDIVGSLFPSARGVEPISSYSSLRPLLRDDSASATSASREHRIWNTPDGVLHIAGGKYTTYRSMSEEAVGLLCAEIAPELGTLALTATTPLRGNTREALKLLKNAATDEDLVALIRDYGVAAPLVLEQRPSAATEIPAVRAARIVYAVEYEMARRLADLMFVSTYWGYQERWTAGSLAPYAREMGARLAWDRGTMASEVESVLQAASLDIEERVA